MELLDRPVIRDPFFWAAVTMVQVGDVAELGRFLDAESHLLDESIVEPGATDLRRGAGSSLIPSCSG